MEAANESRLSFRDPEGFTGHEIHFCIGKCEAVYLHNSARVNKYSDAPEATFTTPFKCALVMVGQMSILDCHTGYQEYWRVGVNKVCRF